MMFNSLRGFEMPRSIDDIEKDALELSVEDRALLIRRLEVGLQVPDSALLDEAERRLKRMEAGDALLIEGESAFTQARQALRDRV